MMEEFKTEMPKKFSFETQEDAKDSSSNKETAEPGNFSMGQSEAISQVPSPETMIDEFIEEVTGGKLPEERPIEIIADTPAQAQDKTVVIDEAPCIDIEVIKDVEVKAVPGKGKIVQAGTKPVRLTTTIQVTHETKAFLDSFPGVNYDEKIAHVRDKWKKDEKRLIDATVAPIISKMDLIK